MSILDELCDGWIDTINENLKIHPDLDVVRYAAERLAVRDQQRKLLLERVRTLSKQLRELEEQRNVG